MKQYVVTISRQFGSMGRMIAQQLSRELGVDFYDRDIVEETASRMGLPVSVISNTEENSKSIYIMALTRTDHAQIIAGRIRQVLGTSVRVMLYPASEYDGYTYLKVYAANACKANMLKILQKRIGAERVITFGSIPGQYDVYVHDDGGNSAVKMLKKLYEGQLL